MQLSEHGQDVTTSEELERWKQNVSDLTQQLNASRSDYAALMKRMEEQQTQVALQRSHMKKQLADQRKRLITLLSLLLLKKSQRQ